MDYKRLALAGQAALLLFLGAAAMFAWRAGFYACLLLALLVAIWVVATWLVRQEGRAGASHAMPPPVDERARTHRRLLAYLDLSPAPLVTQDEERRLRAVNRAARRLFHAEDLIPAAPPALLDAIAAAQPGRSATARLTFGEVERTYALSVADLSGGAERVRIAALTDIEAELKAAEAAALRDLLQVLSHEIMNALTPIASLGRTAAMLLEEGQEDVAAARDAVETVARRAEGLQRFSAAYRDLARLPEPSLARIEMRPFLEDLRRLFATRWPEVRLACDFDVVPVAIRGDADQLSAALWALLQNAAEAAASTQDQPVVTLAAQPVVGGMIWQVRDNGPGIAPADRDAIFRPFFTTKPAGSGVGLALAEQIVRAHRGTLSLCDPQPEEGACFAAFLPVTQAG